MRVFISGIAGFLGSHLADRMLHLGHEVVGVDSLVGGYRENVPGNAEFHQSDCGSLSAMLQYTSGCDVVLHAACTAYEGLSVFSPHLITRNTFQITASVLTAAIQNGVRRFVYCSSMARYGEQDDVPFTEDMVCNPQDPYGIAKYSAELLVRSLCDTHGLEFVIAVPHNIIGPRQKYDDPFRNVASIMINRMLQGQQPIINGDGQQRRCFSYIDDVIGCLEKMVCEPCSVGEVVNVGPDEESVTINQLAHLLGELMKFDVKPIYVESRPQEVRYATCSADRARELLGYRTRTSLRDGLAAMIEYVRKRGKKEFQYHLDLEIDSELCPRVWRERML